MAKINKKGQAGSEALKRQKEEKTKENVKNLKKALKYFTDNKFPLTQKNVAEKANISVSTLNREPYKYIYKEYVDNEKVLFSPNGKSEINNLIKEIEKLKQENEEYKKRYNALKKELTFLKELKFIE